MSVLDIEPGSAALALGAGLIAAVNPCGFALLPAYLSIFVIGDGPAPSPASATGRALRATVALTLGFAGVFLLVGLALMPVAAAVSAVLPVFTVGLGLGLAGAGAWVLAGRSLPKLPRTKRSRTARKRQLTSSWTAMIGFGASYAFASLGCTIAPFLAVVVAAFASQSPADGIALFLIYAGGMGLTVGAAAVSVALARRSIVNHLRRAGSVVTRTGGAVLTVAGLYVAWYGVWEFRVLHGDAGPDPVIAIGQELQLAASYGVDWIGAGGLLLILLVLVAAVLGMQARRILAKRVPTKKGNRMKMQAVFNDVVIAESDDTIVLEGNHYFPEESLRRDLVSPSATQTTCAWKGRASYLNVHVDGATAADAVWFYPTPSAQAAQIKGRIAFWRGVTVRPAANQTDETTDIPSFDAPEGATC